MRIGIDCRFAGTQSGLGRYTRSIVRCLVATPPTGVTYVLIVRSEEEPWLNEVRGAEYLVANIPHFSLAEQLVLPWRLKRTHINLLFSPHFNVPILTRIPFVVTIHDLILHHFPNAASPLKRAAYRFLMGRAVRRAKRIIAVSKFTASEISAMYGASAASRTTVIGEGVDVLFSPQNDMQKNAVLEKYGIPSPFFLYVGNAKEHKNVQMLIDAHAALPPSAPHLVLVTSGQEASRLRHSDRVMRLESVNDTDLPALYSAAEAFVTASLYEGFCLPILEARACGCPVIAPRSTAIPEIADEGCVLIDPTIEGLRRALSTPLPSRSIGIPRRWEDVATQVQTVLVNAV